MCCKQFNYNIKINPQLTTYSLLDINLAHLLSNSTSDSYHVKLHFCEDKLEERSVGDHEDDKEGEGEGDLLEGLDNPKKSQTKGLKNCEENHPESTMQSFFTKIS